MENRLLFFQTLVLVNMVLRRDFLLFVFLRLRFQDFCRPGLLFLCRSLEMRLVLRLFCLWIVFCIFVRLGCRRNFLDSGGIRLRQVGILRLICKAFCLGRLRYIGVLRK